MPCRSPAGTRRCPNEMPASDPRAQLRTAPGVIAGGRFPPPAAPLDAATALASAAPGRRIVDISADRLQVRLAEDAGDIDAAQALRYRIFYESMGARPLPGMAPARRDVDPFDEICDHLLVLDHGRACVDPAYRGRAAMQLLWAGIAAYVFHYDIVLMFGCASLHGTDLDALAAPLSYLYHHHLAPPALRARALPERYVDMRRRDPATIDPA